MTRHITRIRGRERSAAFRKVSITLILFVIRGEESDRSELKLINGKRKINGAENTTSPALILRGKVATRVFQERVQKEIVSAPFLTVRT